MPVAPELFKLLEGAAARYGTTVEAIVEVILEEAVIEDVMERMELMRHS